MQNRFKSLVFWGQVLDWVLTAIYFVLTRLYHVDVPEWDIIVAIITFGYNLFAGLNNPKDAKNF